MKGLRFLLLVLAICLTSGVKAQFYDSADDIYYYVQCDKYGEIKDKGTVLIFNFDGQKAALFESVHATIANVKEKIKVKPDYYEDKVETTEYSLRYTSNNTYQRKGNGESFTNYTFSYDRDLLNYHDHWWCVNGVGALGVIGEYRDLKLTYKRVEKSFFKVGRSRTPSPIHE